MAAITTRETSGGGATVKGSPLTNTELDTNFINLNLGITSAVAITGGTITGITDLAVADGGTGLSSLTAGYIPFGAGTSAFGSSANLFWDSVGNRLGIGTATPATTLDVNGAAYFGNTITTGNGVSTSGASIELGGLRTGDGNSFIDFHSTSGTDNEARIIRGSGVNGNFVLSNTGTGAFNITNASTGAITLNSIGAGNIILSTTNTERMRIDSSGNVGIGTASPSGKFHVSGGRAYFTANAEQYVIAVKYNAATTGMWLGSSGTDTLNISTESGTERMRIDSNGNVGIGITPTNASLLQLAAGTTAKAPLELTSGPVRTTAEGGAFEYLTNVGYFTPTNNNRAVIATEHFVARTGTKTMTSNTSLQSIFGGGTGGLTNGALTVDAATSYYFECLISITSMSATGGNFGFSIGGAGTATFTSAGFFTVGYDNSALTNPAAGGGIYNATAAITTNIIPSQTGTGAAALIKGIFRINGGGTIIPSIQLTTAAAAVIGANSWFKCNPIGDNTVVSVGNWS